MPARRQATSLEEDWESQLASVMRTAAATDLELASSATPVETSKATSVPIEKWVTIYAIIGGLLEVLGLVGFMLLWLLVGVEPRMAAAVGMCAAVVGGVIAIGAVTMSEQGLGWRHKVAARMLLGGIPVGFAAGVASDMWWPGVVAGGGLIGLSFVAMAIAVAREPER